MIPMEQHNKKDINSKIKFVQDTLYVIGGKWKLPILIAIHHGNARFTDIKKVVPGISGSTLSRELKQLEENHLIAKTVYSSKECYYQFAHYGMSLSPVIRSLTEWGKQHRKKLMNI